MRAVVLLLIAASAQAQPIARFFADVHDVERLSDLDFTPMRMESTYDRTGGNLDGYDTARMKNGVYRIADLKGPGVVRRFYSARPGGRLRIFVDGSATPLIDMECEKFFSGSVAPFVRPITGPMGGANYSYFPIPYRESLRIETTPIGDARNQNSVGLYYQVSYETFAANTPVVSLKLPLEAADRSAWERAVAAWRDVGMDPKGKRAGQTTLGHTLRIAPGESAMIADLKGPGVVDRIHLKLDPADDTLLRSTLLRMRWDDHEREAVDTPIGDFFGNAFSRVPYKSLLMGLTPEGWYSYFSMPFGRRAEIRLVNESAREIIVTARVVYRATDGMSAGEGYFHAKWRRHEVAAVNLHGVNKSAAHNYQILDVEGEGRYIGASMNVFNRHLFWWGEGDPMIFVDDEQWPPTMHGTGTEEYFNDAWGFHEHIEAPGATPGAREQNVVPVSAALIPGIAHPVNCFGGNAVFSFHLPDSISFRKRIRVTVEHGTENDFTNDYASTAFWYARPPSRDFFVMPPASERVVIPMEKWEPLRAALVGPMVASLRMRLAALRPELARRPTDERTYPDRMTLVRRLLRFTAAPELPDARRAEMMRWLADTFIELGPARWKVVDRILTDFADRLLK